MYTPGAEFTLCVTVLRSLLKDQLVDEPVLVRSSLKARSNTASWHSKPGSCWHVALQPSPAAVFPSSQVSPASVELSPQAALATCGNTSVANRAVVAIRWVFKVSPEALRRGPYDAMPMRDCRCRPDGKMGVWLVRKNRPNDPPGQTLFLNQLDHPCRRTARAVLVVSPSVCARFTTSMVAARARPK